MTVRTRFFLTTGFVLALGGLFALLPLGARSLEPREIVVVARQMSFYVDGAGSANGAIQLAPGEKVRLTLISADPGFDHDFAVSAWGVKTPALHGEGRTSVLVEAPGKPGRAEYVCTIHASMMKGTIEVVAPRSTGAPGR
jgi:plastocyanin